MWYLGTYIREYPLLANVWIKNQLPEKDSYHCSEELPELHIYLLIR